jgi:hypothetical protein
MKKLLLLTLVLLSLHVSGQVAIIRDKDGYTNVRSKPDNESEIVHRVFENQVFWIDFSVRDTSEWILVFIPKNDFSLGCGDNESITGFIHKSRVFPLERLEQPNNDSFTFKYNIQPFDPTRKIIDTGTGTWIGSIDGRHAWGTDGNMPMNQVSGIEASIDGQAISINRAFYNDLFECTNNFNVYKNGDTYFVWQGNSDGAGYYELVWVFTKEGLKQRLVGSLI